MKKSLLSIASALALTVVVAVPTAGASSGLTIDAPVAGSTVSDTFTLKGTYTLEPSDDGNASTDGSQCGWPLSHGVTDSSGRQLTPYLTADTPAEAEKELGIKAANKQWSIPVNLQRMQVTGGNGNLVAVRPGKITVHVASQAAGCEATVTYNYQPSQTVAAETTPTATPTPTPTPTLTPSASASPATAAANNTISPPLVFLLGALIGAALLSLAEVSALSYLKKHGKGPRK